MAVFLAKPLFTKICGIVMLAQLCNLLLGLKELSPPNLNMLHIFQNETHASEPILFILSLGADPSQELQDLAKSTIGAEKYHQVRDFVFLLCFIGHFPVNLSKLPQCSSSTSSSR